MKLPPPYTPTLFVELIRFTPGQPDNVTNGTPSAAMPVTLPGPSRAGPSTPHTPHSSHSSATNGSSSHPRPIQPIHQSSHHHGHHGHHHGHHHSSNHTPVPPPPPVSYESRPSSSSVGQSHTVPPPPPWTSSRWSNAAAAAAPPSARSHTMPEPLRSPLATPPQTHRKRKYPDDVMPPSEDRLQVHVSPVVPSPKRHHSSSHTPQPGPAPMPRATIGMSPSLAMMLSPTPMDLRSPPRVSTSSSSSSYSSRPLAMQPGPSARLPEDAHSSHGQRKPRLKLPYREDGRWDGSPSGPSPRRSPPVPPPPRP